MELGAHQIVAKLQLGRILLVPVRARAGELFERAHALGRHRMRLHVGIGVARGEQDFVGHALERVVHALRRLAGGGEELDAGAVGRFLLLALIGEERAADHFLRSQDRRGRIAGIAARAATIAPTPSSIEMIDCVCATASCWRSFDRWPPAIWPVSWASTPMISFGVLESISAPAFTKMRRPSMTKALNDLSLISVTWMFCCARPAVLRIGCV